MILWIPAVNLHPVGPPNSPNSLHKPVWREGVPIVGLGPFSHGEAPHFSPKKLGGVTLCSKEEEVVLDSPASGESNAHLFYLEVMVTGHEPLTRQVLGEHVYISTFGHCNLYRRGRRPLAASLLPDIACICSLSD